MIKHTVFDTSLDTVKASRMKTLVIIVGVLAVTTTVYGINTPRLKTFVDNLGKCSGEFGGSAAEPTVETLVCALDKDGNIFNTNGEYIKDATLHALEESISDATRLQNAQEIFTKCYDDAVQSGSTGREQTMKIAPCAMPTLSLLDKL